MSTRGWRPDDERSRRRARSERSRRRARSERSRRRARLEPGLPPHGRAKRGSDLETMWRHLVGELGGEIVYDRRGKPTRAAIPFRNWLLVIDIYTQSTGDSSRTFTRVRALFARRGSFRLRVTRRTPFHRLAPLFGVRPVDVGYNRIDRTLFVRSDEPAVARTMLRGTSLGQALLEDPKQALRVQPPGRRIRKRTADSVGEVQVLKPGRVKELSVLRGMVQLTMWTLDEMVRARVALESTVEGVAI